MSKVKLTAAGLRGVWTALVTPFKVGRIDKNRLADLVERAVAAGLTGIAPVGTTGEAPALSQSEWEKVIETTVKTADGRIKVVPGVGTNNTQRTQENMRCAADLGADGALLVAPYYNKPTPDGLRRHFLACADVSNLPVILYHIPGRCGVGIPTDLTLQLARHPNFIGLKDAGGDILHVSELARRAPHDFAILSGDDQLTLPFISVGAVGVISVISNLAPKMTKQMVDYALKGDFESALELHRKFAVLNAALTLETNPGPIKETLNIKGIKVGSVRAPLASVRPETRKALKKALAELGDFD
ncbi:MAG: 4-hydroxy-tetrahydrodipicolinate synthase [Calditrichaeota bacterium]|nr:4-hydroxy-tetrahydrodipicolinate synthase [Calditrichota bacterium]